jgi:hypothetical protein
MQADCRARGGILSSPLQAGIGIGGAAITAAIIATLSDVDLERWLLAGFESGHDWGSDVGAAGSQGMRWRYANKT